MKIMYRMCQAGDIPKGALCNCLPLSQRAPSKGSHWPLLQIGFGMNLTQRQNGSYLIFVYPALIKSASVHANALCMFTDL